MTGSRRTGKQEEAHDKNLFNPSSAYGHRGAGPEMKPPKKSLRSLEPRDPNAEKTPRWDSLRRGVSQTWTSTVRVFRLVWQTSKWQTLALALLTLLLAVIPAMQVCLAGALID